MAGMTWRERHKRNYSTPASSQFFSKSQSSYCLLEHTFRVGRLESCLVSALQPYSVPLSSKPNTIILFVRSILFFMITSYYQIELVTRYS